MNDAINTDRLRKAAKCVYLATEKSVADDLSAMLSWAATEIEWLHNILGEVVLNLDTAADGVACVGRRIKERLDENEQ